MDWDLVPLQSPRMLEFLVTLRTSECPLIGMSYKMPLQLPGVGKLIITRWAAEGIFIPCMAVLKWNKSFRCHLVISWESIFLILVNSSMSLLVGWRSEYYWFLIGWSSFVIDLSHAELLFHLLQQSPSNPTRQFLLKKRRATFTLAMASTTFFDLLYTCPNFTRKGPTLRMTSMFTWPFKEFESLYNKPLYYK